MPLVCTATSVLGGMLGYAIGALLYDSVGHWLIEFYGLGGKVEAFRASYAEWGALIILCKGLTPIPYKLVTITSGFANYNIWLFVLCSVIARGGRFFMVAILLNRYGEWIRVRIEKRLGLWVALGAAAARARFYRRHPNALKPRVKGFAEFAACGYLACHDGWTRQPRSRGEARQCRDRDRGDVDVDDRRGRRVAASARRRPRLASRSRPASLAAAGGPAPPAPAREENPGLINEMGKLFEKSLSILPPLKVRERPWTIGIRAPRMRRTTLPTACRVWPSRPPWCPGA